MCDVPKQIKHSINPIKQSYLEKKGNEVSALSPNKEGRMCPHDIIVARWRVYGRRGVVERRVVYTE